METLSFKEFSTSLENGVAIIVDRLPKMITLADWSRIVDEFSRMEQKFHENLDLQKDDEDIPINQTLMGMTNETMASIYTLVL